MVNNIRVLNSKRISGENKPSGMKQNRNARREFERLANRQKKKIALISGMPRNDEGIIRENSEAGQEGLVRKPDVPGFARSRAGLLISAVLAAELVAAGCGSVVMDDTEDGDASTDVQVDGGDAQEDSADPDVLEVDEGSVDADVEDTLDVLDITDELEALDEGSGDILGDEADVPVCEPITYLETRPAESAGIICGINREKIVTLQVTEYGEGCPRPGRETSLESVVFRIMRPLDLANLMCARGNETEALNPGVYLIISLSPTEIQMGLKLASALNMTTSSPNLSWAGYQLDLEQIPATSRAENNLFDASGTFIRRINVPGQTLGGFVAIDLSNGVFAWNINPPISASQGIIRLNGGLLIVLPHLGTHDYESPGDEGRFTVRLNIDGMGSDDSYGFHRIRGKK